jgi:succinyl-diaminopimelate desuccinylase
LTGDASPLEALTLELIGIPSPIGSERALADHVEAWARERGFAEVTRGGDGLALRPRPFRDGHAHLLLLGHLDTVPPADVNPPRIEGDRIYGLGASDMKSGDALLLHLLALAVEREPNLDVTGVLYAREEGPYDESGLPEVADAAPHAFEHVDLAIALEPTDNHFEMGCLGTMHATVAFHGRRAHSARPWEGRNAVHMAAPLLARIAALEPQDRTFEGLLFREVCSVTMLDYDGARNVIPGRFEVNVNYRFAPDRSGEEAGAWLAGLVRDAVGAEALDRGDVTIEVTDLCPSGRVCTDNPVFQSLAEAAGPGTETRAKQAWTDVGRLSTMGIDAINFGPGSPSQAHQAGEHCVRSHLEEARQLMERWLWA